MNLDNYNVSQATHRLACRHCIGVNCYDYAMECILLGTTESGRAKIVVFGDRDRRGYDHLKRIRYVRPSKLIKMEKKGD